MHQNIVPVIGGSDSLDEQIQREFPAPGLSKALNTVNCSVMVDRARVPGEYISDRRCASGPPQCATTQHCSAAQTIQTARCHRHTLLTHWVRSTGIR